MKAYLILADGTVYEGESIGKVGETVGEVVFTTGMCGFMETVADKSYYGQIVIQTFPLIGNYGAILSDVNNVPQLAGYVVRELCETGSNFRKECEFDEYLSNSGVVGISGLDTREITRKIRENGVINGMITTDKKGLDEKLKLIKKFKITDAVKNTSSTQPVILNENGKYKIVLWDFGATANVEDELIKRDACVVKIPSYFTIEQILEYKPNGILLSNGGGNPSENKEIIGEIKKLLEHKIPMLAIGLGHQLLALANGASVVKLKYGHRGGNQPVKDLKLNKTFISLQNHGYAVMVKSLNPDICELRYSNVNDKTCEGIEYKNTPSFSVQFIPDASSAPHETKYLFDTFLKLVKER